MDAHLLQWLSNEGSVAASDESNQNNFTAKLPEHPRDIASFAARLCKDAPAALNPMNADCVDLQDSVDGQVRCDHEQHAASFHNPRQNASESISTDLELGIHGDRP
jgi:hypothetical protein